jgi:hypothetical protein
LVGDVARLPTYKSRCEFVVHCSNTRLHLPFWRGQRLRQPCTYTFSDTVYKAPCALLEYFVCSAPIPIPFGLSWPRLILCPKSTSPPSTLMRQNMSITLLILGDCEFGVIWFFSDRPPCWRRQRGKRQKSRRDKNKVFPARCWWDGVTRDLPRLP